MEPTNNKTKDNPIISFQDFSFRYRSQKEPTVKHINLDIYPGEKVLITGPSGCGKSTIAHCINGLIPGSFPGEIKGKLLVDGKEPKKAGVFGMSKKVGTVLQDTDGQFIGLTVAEDLAFALENDALPQEEIFQKVNRAADIVEMRNFLDHAPGELSGGQKQRVSMGGVLVDDVKILLFDEPLANLDPATGKRTIDLIERIRQKQDVTVVIIEHRLEDVLYRDVDRIVVMREGEIAADESPDRLLCTDLLEKEGVREPLYIAALKHAGAVLKPEDHPQHIETMNLLPYREQVRSWFARRFYSLINQISDADIVDGELVVKRYYSEKEDLVRENRTKAGHGPRRIPLTNLAQGIIRTICEDCEENPQKGDYIFVTDEQQMHGFYNRMRKTFPLICKDLGIPDNTLYAGRRTFVSSLLDDNVNIKTIQNYVGHKDAKTTLNHYCFDRSGKQHRIEQLENARLGLSLADVIPDESKSVPTVPKSEAI